MNTALGRSRLLGNLFFMDLFFGARCKDMLEDIEVMFYNFPFAVQLQRGFR